MRRIANNVTELIGNTPLVRLGKLSEELDALIVAKLEYFNPCGSVKDRIGFAMIEQAEKEGLLKNGSVIVEPTSGNTGIGLALVSAVKGYKCILTMPETMSVERRKILKAFGVDVVLTPGNEGMRGAVEAAEKIVSETPGSFMPQQFNNSANPDMHYRTTAKEIWDDTDGEVDAVVAGVGTGGTITGIARYMKNKKKDFKAVAVEPANSPVLSGGAAGPHRIQGIGAGFVPGVLQEDLIDEVVKVSDEDAVYTAGMLASREGIFAGISSGAAVAAALKTGGRKEYRGKMIVVIIPDLGDRYLSSLV